MKIKIRMLRNTFRQLPKWNTCTYTGLNVQLASFLIPLLEELSRYQLRNLHQREFIQSVTKAEGLICEHDIKTSYQRLFLNNNIYCNQKLERLVLFFKVQSSRENNAFGIFYIFKLGFHNFLWRKSVKSPFDPLFWHISPSQMDKWNFPCKNHNAALLFCLTSLAYTCVSLYFSGDVLTRLGHSSMEKEERSEKK